MFGLGERVFVHMFTSAVVGRSKRRAPLSAMGVADPLWIVDPGA